MKKVFNCVFFVFSLAAISHGAEYTIDPAHSKVMFKVRHLGISTVTGNFKTYSGTFDLDPGNLMVLRTSATIETASVNTDEPKRDEHLRGPDFFDVAKFPQMKFVSKEIKETGTKTLSITGDLTLHGVTKPVVLAAEFGGAVKDPGGNERAAFTASATVNRKDFGMIFSKTLDTGGVMVGDEIRIEIEVEGVKKK